MSPPSTKSPYYELGSFHRSITTKSSECQTWFDRGLIWAYGFNHQEAVKCFEYALAHDPDCPMAVWGIAYASGPHYNKSWELFDQADLEATLKKTHQTAKEASLKIQYGTPVEQALLKAIHYRYPEDTPSKDYSKWNNKYADEMGEVYQQFPDDLDVAFLYVDAMMNLSPWRLWDLKSGQPAPGTRTVEAKRVLDKTLESKIAWSHPGLLHLYIHLMEMSPEPEKALLPADRLRNMNQDAGHLRHMPSHIDILVGDYRAAILANEAAVIADEKFLAENGPNNFYTVYRLHNYHTLIYAAMFAGQLDVSLEYIKRIEESMPESLLRTKSPPMATWAEIVHSFRMHVLIRFGRWDDILAYDLPHDQELFCSTTAFAHYGKGIAHAAQGNIEKAAEQQELFEQACTRVPSSRMDFPNKVSDKLKIASAMLNGELEYRRGNYDTAFDHLQKAVDLDDSLIYSEPWGWTVPTRHAYAALLLEQGHVEKAEALYRADLGFDKTLPRARQHPNNVWALHGFHECLRKLGKTAEAELLDLQLKVAVAVADVDVTSSCYCRVETEPVKIVNGAVPAGDAACCAAEK